MIVNYLLKPEFVALDTSEVSSEDLYKCSEVKFYLSLTRKALIFLISFLF